MDVSLIANTVLIGTQQTPGSTNFFFATAKIASTSQINPPKSAPSSLMPWPRRLSSRKTSRHTLLRKRRRTRRKSQTDGDSDGFGEEYGFFCGGDCGGLFNAGGDGYGGGGRAWNFEGHNWDETSWWFSSRSSGFSYGFVYEVIYWTALSNCVHFAFKKVVRIVADGIGDTERGKAVPLRLTIMC